LVWSQVDADHLASFYDLAMSPEANLDLLSVPDPTVPDHFQKLRTSTKRSFSDTKTITFVTGNKKKLEEVQVRMDDE
jgi:hypothetical protein